VPKNQAVVWGSNLESFDSRYWGFIGYDRLRAMEYNSVNLKNKFFCVRLNKNLLMNVCVIIKFRARQA
jgi:hypothetical protein